MVPLSTRSRKASRTSGSKWAPSTPPWTGGPGWSCSPPSGRRSPTPPATPRPATSTSRWRWETTSCSGCGTTAGASARATTAATGCATWPSGPRASGAGWSSGREARAAARWSSGGSWPRCPRSPLGAPPPPPHAELPELKGEFQAQQAARLVWNLGLETCARCGHVDSGSRPARDRFCCLGCGHQAHADMNAAEVIRGRGIELASAGGLPVAARGARPSGPAVKREPDRASAA